MTKTMFGYPILPSGLFAEFTEASPPLEFDDFSRWIFDDRFKYCRAIHGVDDDGNPTITIQGARDDRMIWEDVELT